MEMQRRGFGMLHARSGGENGYEAKRLIVRAASSEEKKHKSDRALLAMKTLLILFLSLTLAP